MRCHDMTSSMHFMWHLHIDVMGTLSPYHDFNAHVASREPIGQCLNKPYRYHRITGTEQPHVFSYSCWHAFGVTASSKSTCIRHRAEKPSRCICVTGLDHYWSSTMAFAPRNLSQFAWACPACDANTVVVQAEMIENHRWIRLWM